MTKQEVKKKLRKYVDLKKEQDLLQKKIAELEGKKGEVIKLFSMYAEKDRKLVQECLWIEKTIEDLEPIERTVARLYYIEGYTWERVCVELSYSWTQIHRIHDKLLDKIFEKLKQDAL